MHRISSLIYLSREILHNACHRFLIVKYGPETLRPLCLSKNDWLTAVRENEQLRWDWRREVRAEKVTAWPVRVDWL